MPQVLDPTQVAPEPPPPRKRWTRKECAFLVDNGLLVGRYELINGEILDKMGQGPRHVYVIGRLTSWLFGVFGADHVRMQSPIDVAPADDATNEPEPDGAVLRTPDADFLDRQPGPEDVLLVIEVSDTTLRFDTKTKADLYARAGIPDYWVLDVNGRRIVVHRDPVPEGYQSVLAYAAEEEVAPLSAPQALVRAADLLPPLPQTEG